MAERDAGFAQRFDMQQRQASHHGTILHLSAVHPSFRSASQMASRSDTPTPTLICSNDRVLEGRHPSCKFRQDCIKLGDVHEGGYPAS
jgi:hypothetical protein